MDYAQLKTIKTGMCLDKNNQEIPWYTYPAVEYLQNIDFAGKTVLEYGCGNSSFFWCRKAAKVTSIEHNREWFDKISRIACKNHELIFCAEENYESPAEIEGRKFDIIIIDAVKRPECAKILRRYLDLGAADGCMVILDNSDWYKNSARFIREDFDMIEADFHGFGPINGYTWTTSVFFSRNFRFKPVDNVQPHFSVAAIRENYD
jgi:hypothetical protein